ncbi:hypothetical protein HRbin01_00713 [archaeon HR01]|nr:hypothetical protein HRbin01_00713 [archaeon HR01]
MMSMETTMFRDVSTEFLEMTRLISLYRQVSRSLVLTKQMIANFGDKHMFYPVLQELKKQKDRVARRIIKLAKQTHPEYKKLTKVLGIDKRRSLYGKTALATLLAYVDFSNGLRKILCYVGNYYPHNGKYNPTLKKAAESLTMSVLQKRRCPTGKEIRQVLKTIRTTLAGGQA